MAESDSTSASRATTAKRHLAQLQGDLHAARKAAKAALALVDLLSFQAERGYTGSCLLNADEQPGLDALNAMLTEVAAEIDGAEQEADEVEGALSDTAMEAANG